MKASSSSAPEINSLKDFFSFLGKELKPTSPLTLFDMISLPIIILGGILIIYRFIYGLGSITNLSQDFPWGIWIGLDVMAGVAFAGGSYVLCFVVYVLRVEKYHSIVRVTILNGFLAYVFYAGALLLDLGRPWHIFNPILGNEFGFNSVLFLIAWKFVLYMLAQLIEISPAFAEWLGMKRARRILSTLTLGAVIFGVTLSVLHQSGLGALFLMAKGKLHPLWYSNFLPVLFFVSSIFAGLALVIFEGSITSRIFAGRISEKHHREYPEIVFGLARICAGVMFVYLFLQLLILIQGRNIAHLATPMGYWYLVENLGFVLLPGWLFFLGIRRGSLSLVKWAAVLTMLGILLNRLNVSIIAYKWYAPVHYVPSWMEIVTTMAIIFAKIWVLRWVITRMPILQEPPGWVNDKV